MAALVYATVGSNRLDDARAFYDALLGSVGIKPVFEHPSGGRVYGANRTPNFAVLAPHDGQSAPVGNGSMFAFAFDTRERSKPSTPGPFNWAAPAPARPACAAPACGSATSATSTATSSAPSA